MCAVAAHVGIDLLIGHDVREIVASAQSVAPGDPVESLLHVVNSPRIALSERNRAVWALGQLGDERALATLESEYTGGACDHQNALCQKELEKAIDLCRGGTNLGAYIWRRGDLAVTD